MIGIENAGGGTGWRSAARCARTADPEAFFPDRSAIPAEALAICRDCPVQPACRQHALGHPERFGVWGGLTEAERDRLLKASGTPRPVRRPSAWVGVSRRRIGV